MRHLVEHRNGARAPSPIDWALGQALAAAASEASFGALTAAALPEGMRRELESRRRQLELSLEPCGKARMIAILATLDRMVARTEIDPARADAQLDLDLADLAGLPEWALEAAAAAFRRGEQGDGRMRPLAGQLRMAAARLVDRHAAELAKLRTVLAARIEPPKKPLEPQRRKDLAETLRGAARAMSLRGEAP